MESEKTVQKVLNQYSELCENVTELVNSDLGEKYALKINISDIEELYDSFKSYENIIKLYHKKHVLIECLALMSSETILIYGLTTQERRRVECYSWLVYLAPILCLFFVFFHSWVWLLLAPVSGVFFYKLLHKTYYQAIFNKALSSELLFSFLFTINAINLRDLKTGECWYFQGE